MTAAVMVVIEKDLWLLVSETVEQVEAELKRAEAARGAATSLVRLTLADGPKVRVKPAAIKYFCESTFHADA